MDFGCGGFDDPDGMGFGFGGFDDPDADEGGVPQGWGGDAAGHADLGKADEPAAVGKSLQEEMQGGAEAPLSRSWGARYFERQVAAECGQHALNNILGGPRCQRKDLAAAAWQVVAETRDPKAEHIRDWKSIDFLMKSIEKTSILSARTSGTEKVSISY